MSIECMNTCGTSETLKNTYTGALFMFLIPIFTLIKISVGLNAKGRSNQFLFC